MTLKIDNNISPQFSRGELAKILNVTPLTIANREKRGLYFKPSRDKTNGYRRYSLSDVLSLQIITNGKIDARIILSVLYDKGYHDPKVAAALIDDAISRTTQLQRL